GVSTRAAAESAARAGFDVTAIDAFADADQHPAVRAISIPRPFTAHAAAAAASGIECDAVAYLANFENHPDAVRALSVDRTLWGNSPEVLHKVRDPQGLTRALRDRGIAAPAVRCPSAASHSHEAHKRQHEVPVDTEWLVKPLASGGGHGVRPWREGERVPNGCYLQQRIDGVPGAIAFVAARGRAVLLGVCRQLIGEPAFGAAGYRYCGSILNIAVEPPLVRAVSAIAETVSDESDLVGVNGIDFVAHSGEPYAIEVNPRWTASMEVVERAYDL